MKTKNIYVIIGLFVLTLSIIATVAVLLVPEEYQNNKFYLALGTILFAITLLFYKPIRLSMSGPDARKILPIHFGASIVYMFYAGLVLVLAFIAMTPIPFKFLLVLHLVLFLLLALVIGGTLLAAMSATDSDTKHKKQRIPFIVLKNHFDQVCDRLKNINEASELFKQCDQFRRETLEYAVSESLPGSESEENEMDSCLKTIECDISELEELFSKEEDGDVAKRSASDKIIQKINKEFSVLTQVTERREKLMKQLR